jgi:hypothetical protein
LRSWSGSSGGNTRTAGAPGGYQQQQQQQQQQKAPSAPGASRAAASLAQQQQQSFSATSRNGSGSGGGGGGFNAHDNAAASGSLAGSALDTIYEAGESEGVDGSSSDPSRGHATGASGPDSGGYTSADEEGMSADEGAFAGARQQLQQQYSGDDAEAWDGYDEQQQHDDEHGAGAYQLAPPPPPQQQQQQLRAPPPAPPLRLSKLKPPGAQRQGQQQLASSAAVSRAAVGALRQSHVMQQQQPQQQYAPAPSSSTAGAATIAAAAAAAANQRAARAQQEQAALAQMQQAGSDAEVDLQQQLRQDAGLAATGGFMSPATQHIDLSAITEAVAARLLGTTQQQQQQQQQQAYTGSPHSPVMQQVGLHAPITPPATYYYSAPHAAAWADCGSSPAAAAAGVNNTVSYGSGSRAWSSGGRGQAQGSGSNPASRPDSANGWGRNSLAGLYASGASAQHAAGSVSPPPQVQWAPAAGAGADESGGTAFVGDYSSFGLQHQHQYQHQAAAAAAAAAASLPEGLIHSRAAAVSSASHAAFAAAGGGASSSSSSAARRSVVASSGVAAAEYIIPSVLCAVANCPEGRGLAQQLVATAGLTPHQRCLAMLRWAFGVYQQLPLEARRVSVLCPEGTLVLLLV